MAEAPAAPAVRAHVLNPGADSYLPTLDGWRAIAILIVICSHIAQCYYGDTRSGRIIEQAGAQGVALFFAISGFLITTLLLKEQDGHGRVSLWRFYVRRACRILPAALAYLSTIALLAVGGFVAVRPGELTTALFFASNYWTDKSYMTSHFWSLSVEEHFYVLWPALIALTRRRTLVYLACGLIVGEVLWRPFGMTIAPRLTAMQRTDMRVDAFLCAGLLAVFVHQGNRLLANRRTAPVSFALLLAANAAALRWPELRGLKDIAQSILLPCVVISTVLNSGITLSRLLEFSFLRIIGQFSYGIYLWQQLAIVPSRVLPYPLARVALLVVCVVTSYYCIETPLRKFGRQVGRVRRTTAMDARVSEA